MSRLAQTLPRTPPRTQSTGAGTEAAGTGKKSQGAPWRILATCPERWPELVGHPTLGTAVQHLLLDHAEAEQDLNRQKAATGNSFLMRGIQGDSEENLEPGLSLDADLLETCLPCACRRRPACPSRA
ncbi:hypothetical protein GCM10010317_062790 [Streptomyces mirabilis]|nr:hypothetical protein GCM10010317_062790 [Streptomyces mirabilis]